MKRLFIQILHLILLCHPSAQHGYCTTVMQMNVEIKNSWETSETWPPQAPVGDPEVLTWLAINQSPLIVRRGKQASLCERRRAETNDLVAGGG